MLLMLLIKMLTIIDIDLDRKQDNENFSPRSNITKLMNLFSVL